MNQPIASPELTRRTSQREVTLTAARWACCAAAAGADVAGWQLAMYRAAYQTAAAGAAAEAVRREAGRWN